MENLKNNVKRIELNSVMENNLILYDCISKGEIEKLICLVKKGYPVNAFILNALEDLNYGQYIERVLDEAIGTLPDTYEFLEIYWDKDKANDFFVRKKFLKTIENFFDNKELLKYGLIDSLLKRDDGKEFYIMNATFEEVLNNKDCFPLPAKFFSECVDSEDKMEMVYNHGRYKEELVYAKGGIKFLLDKGEYKILLRYRNIIPEVLGFETWFNLLENVYKSSGAEAVYKLGGDYYLLKTANNNPSNSDLLKPFINNKAWDTLCDHEFYDVIDWDDYYNQISSSFSRECFFIGLRKAKKWDLLEKYGKSKILFKNKKFIRAIRALFK